MKKFRHLYGPVPSRRLGRSLGVDLVPHKVCTYDCIYCQIGKTTDKTPSRKEYVPVEEILDELKDFFTGEAPPVDHISLGGSGEPTLHSKISDIIKGAKAIGPVPVAVITNGSLLFEERVRRDLLEADVVLPSLDAVSAEVFEKINRPGRDFPVEKVIDGLVDFRKIYRGQIWLEILFCKGVNDSPEELLALKEAVERIHPDRIHLNTVVRPPSEKWVAPLTRKEVEEFRSFFGDQASIISEFDRHLSPPSEEEMAERILDILKRRPLSLSDLSKLTGISETELEGHLIPLVAKRKVHVSPFGNSTYYEVRETS
jgi:wyosine [tRNA(Phe)-imidazoG37] synthetase (radical SAM superfamily)